MTIHERYDTPHYRLTSDGRGMTRTDADVPGTAIEHPELADDEARKVSEFEQRVREFGVQVRPNFGDGTRRSRLEDVARLLGIDSVTTRSNAYLLARVEAELDNRKPKGPTGNDKLAQASTATGSSPAQKRDATEQKRDADQPRIPLDYRHPDVQPKAEPRKDAQEDLPPWKRSASWWDGVEGGGC